MKRTAHPGTAGDGGRVVAAAPPSARRGDWRLGALATLGCLAATTAHMRPEWTLNETYHYGWLVPLLAGYLGLLRWRDRPTARPSAQECLPAWALAAVALLVLWTVHVANPEWRLVGLGLVATTVAVTLMWVWAAGGGPWVRHFAGAIGFLLIAAPWPTPLETAVTTPLMEANAGLALEALHWLGITASRSGSLITVPGVTLGVEEACSGIRSLQATLMMAFFLGEMGPLRWRHRGLLLALGVATALLTNVARTVWLSVLATGPSPAAADRWHDAAGLAVLALHAAVLLVSAHWLGRRSGHTAERSAGVRAGGGSPRWPRRGPAVVLASLALLVPFTAWWFGRSTPTAPPDWTLRAPTSAPHFEETPIPPRTRLILRYNNGWSARWRTADGHQLQAFYLTWRAGQVPPEILHAHQPGHCLTLAGMTHVRDHEPPLAVNLAPAPPLPARCFEFIDRGRPLYVFHAVEESASGQLDGSSSAGLGFRARLHAAWHGRRSEGLRLIEIGIWNAAGVDDARALAADFLKEHLVMGGEQF